MRCPTQSDLPPPPAGTTGWPWTVATPPAAAPPSPGAWPRISIVTPSFNQAQFLEQTIRSVLLQSYPDLEYIVIDGGSADGSQAVIRKYEPWLAAWSSERDRGQSHAINQGLRQCTGDLITFQSSDDMYLPGALLDAAQHWQAGGSAAGAIIGAFVFMDAASSVDDIVHPPTLPHPGPIDLTLGPPGIYRLHQVATFYGRAALDEVGRHVREDLRYVMDRELLYRVCRHHPICLSDCVYGAFRQHTASKSGAETLPFAQEFARLYLEQQSGDRQADRRRRYMARYRVSRGYLKHARLAERRSAAAGALVMAALASPEICLRRAYLRTWAEVLGLRAPSRVPGYHHPRPAPVSAKQVAN